MGLFNNVFGSSNEKKSRTDLPWIDLNSNLQLDSIKESSAERPQIIFKHSTRCGISRMVMNQFVANYKFDKEEADLYYLDLLNKRDISAEISKMFDVRHESPQLIVVKNGEVVAHDSHGGINDIKLEELV
ncbi:bacillithiol system protein YtxJ [Flavobacteriaceae bacterium MAR_2010_188]|nr:bacillithiol system protein YtxJ [Flavobacteriaceae bacterium MAR_2010_188]